MLTTGNSWAIAVARGLLTAALLGASAALATWSETDSFKLIAIAGLTPFVGALLLRVGGEGYLDRRNPDASPIPPAFAPKPEVGP